MVSTKKHVRTHKEEHGGGGGGSKLCRSSVLDFGKTNMKLISTMHGLYNPL